MTDRRVMELAQAIAENAWHQGRLQVACRNLATQWKAKDDADHDAWQKRHGLGDLADHRHEGPGEGAVTGAPAPPTAADLAERVTKDLAFAGGPWPLMVTEADLSLALARSGFSNHDIFAKSMFASLTAIADSVPKAAAPPYAVDPAGPLTEAQLAAAIYCHPSYGPGRGCRGGDPGCKCEVHYAAVRALLIGRYLIALDPVGPGTAAR